MCPYIILKNSQPIYIINIVPIIYVVSIVCELGIIEALYKLTVNFIFIFCVGITYLLTPWCRVLLEKLTGLQLVKKFPAFHKTRRFITALTSVRHLSLSWASPIQSIYTHATSWRSVLILSTHLHLGLPSGLLPSSFPTKTLYTPLSSPIRATCPAHLCVGISVKKNLTKKGFKHPSNLMWTYQPLLFFSVIPVNRQVVLKKYSLLSLVLGALCQPEISRYFKGSCNDYMNYRNMWLEWEKAVLLNVLCQQFSFFTVRRTI